MTDVRTENTVEHHLRLMVHFREMTGTEAPSDEFAYPSYDAMVLALGRPFERKPMPREFRRMKLGYCYRNAIHCVQSDPERYRYVEGYAAGMIPTEHAWVLDTRDGKIFDPTWSRDAAHGNYYGIVFPFRFVVEKMLRRKVYGLLATDWMFDNELLKAGEAAWEGVE